MFIVLIVNVSLLRSLHIIPYYFATNIKPLQGLIHLNLLTLPVTASCLSYRKLYCRYRCR